MAGPLTLAVAGSVIAALTNAGDVTLKDHVVRLSDVAVVTGPDAETANRIEVAELAGPLVTISRKDLARLIVRAAPAIRVAGASTGSIRIHAPAANPVARPAPYADEPKIRRGDELKVGASVGPVTIERSVIALQDASARQRRLFVRSSDGEVFATPVRSGDAK